MPRYLNRMERSESQLHQSDPAVGEEEQMSRCSGFTDRERGEHLPAEKTGAAFEVSL